MNPVQNEPFERAGLTLKLKGLQSQRSFDILGDVQGLRFLKNGYFPNRSVYLDNRPDENQL